MDKRHQLFRDLGKYSQSVGVVALGFVGYLLNLKFEKNTNDLDFYISTIGIIAVILFGLAPVLFIFSTRESKNDVLGYTKQRFMERDGKWRIRIIHPTTPITKCQVLVNGIVLTSSKHGDTFEHTIETGGGDNFIIERSTLDNSKVEIKSDGKVIWKGEFSDLELSNP